MQPKALDEACPAHDCANKLYAEPVVHTTCVPDLCVSRGGSRVLV